MTNPESLCWTTLDETAEALFHIALVGDARESYRAFDLLAHLAPPSLEARIVAFLVDDEMPPHRRRDAVRTLDNMRATPPSPVYRTLLAEAAVTLALDEPSERWNRVDVSRILNLARSPALVELTLAWISALPEDSVEGCLTALDASGAPDDALLDALFARWVRRFERSTPTASDVDFACRFAARCRHAFAMVANHWMGRASLLDRAFCDHAGRAPALAEALSAELRESAITQLALPTEALRDALGDRAFARKLKAAVLHYSFARRCPSADDGSALTQRYESALSHLERVPFGRELVADLVTRALLHPSVLADLAARWMTLDPPAAFAWAARSVRAHDDPALAKALIERLTWEIAPSALRDEFLERLLDHPDDAIKGAALHALGARPENPRWSDALRAYATDEALRPEALGLLASRGDDATLDALTAAVSDAHDPYDRLYAIGVLRRFPARVRAHREVFEAALYSTEGVSYDGDCPVARVAARTLAHGLGDDARTPLLRAIFGVEHSLAASDITSALAELVHGESV